MIEKDELLARNVFVFNPRDNGGEQLLLVSNFVGNSEDGCYLDSQELTLNSYGNTATFDLAGTLLTPLILRDLADQLDASLEKAKVKLAISVELADQ